MCNSRVCLLPQPPGDRNPPAFPEAAGATLSHRSTNVTFVHPLSLHKKYAEAKPCKPPPRITIFLSFVWSSDDDEDDFVAPQRTPALARIFFCCFFRARVSVIELADVVAKLLDVALIAFIFLSCLFCVKPSQTDLVLSRVKNKGDTNERNDCRHGKRPSFFKRRGRRGDEHHHHYRCSSARCSCGACLRSKVNPICSLFLHV